MTKTKMAKGKSRLKKPIVLENEITWKGGLPSLVGKKAHCICRATYKVTSVSQIFMASLPIQVGGQQKTVQWPAVECECGLPAFINPPTSDEGGEWD